MSSWPDGTRPYLDPVYAGNQALKKGWAIYGDQPPRFDEATYYLRYAKNGKRVYKRLGSGAQQALVAKKRLEFRLRAAADGIELPPDESTGEPDSPFTTGRPLLDCITSYLKEIAVHKSKKTLAAYLPTVHGFDEFFGNLHHLNCEEEPERPDYPSAKDFPKFREQYGPRGVLHCWATDKDDATERPRWGRVGKQKIEDTTGSDLLMTAPQVQPDVVIVDLGLPLLNGMDASRET